jgi:hypothetical protein
MAGTKQGFLDAFLEGEGAWGEVDCRGEALPVLTREFWTSKQRQAHALHEVSYRACYKPQLPRLFIETLTQPGDRVYDPFSGRGTTALEAALLGRRAAANDINPLSRILLEPRLTPPDLDAVEARLREIPVEGDGTLDLEMFFHPDTEREIRSLRAWFLTREARGDFDALDAWIRMVATSRLTGHSPGFFSVYTLPPNQAVTPSQQVEINRKRLQTPGYRSTKALILRKSKQLVGGLSTEEVWRLKHCEPLLLTGSAEATPALEDGSVRLTVTSPPFLDVVQYQADNWMRCWFCGLDAAEIGKGITMARTVEAWAETMAGVFRELYRVTAPGGHVAFEVGEVRKGTVRLEEIALPVGVEAGFEAQGVLINQQAFTKTANIWGVNNNTHGTNSNRIALFKKN